MWPHFAIEIGNTQGQIPLYGLMLGCGLITLFLGVDSQYVSQDEGDFLEVLAAFQRGETERALARLDVWLPVSGTRIAGPAFKEFACCLAKGGLSIGSRQERNPIQHKLRKLAITGARLH